MFDITIRTLNGLLMIAMPLTLGVVLMRKLNTSWQLFGVGMATFIASQVLHIPFNTWVLNPVVKRLGLSMDLPGELAAVALLAGLSAGIFEETARYLVYRFWLKDKRERTWESALMFGAGHGGVESLILGVLVVYGFIKLFALKDADLQTLVGPEQLELTQSQVALFWSTPWYAALLGAVERAATICFHLSAAVLVLQAFRRNNIVWLFLAVGWHTLLDALAVFGSRTWNIYLTEGLIVAAGLLSIGIVFLLRELPAPDEPDAPEEIEENLMEIESKKPTMNHLEDSRYV